jgi:hypothetical protein
VLANAEQAAISFLLLSLRVHYQASVPLLQIHQAFREDAGRRFAEIRC